MAAVAAGHDRAVPELPDVEGFRRVALRASGHEVRAVHVPMPELLRNTTRHRFAAALRGHAVGRPHRHGKWLFTPIGSDVTAVWHFGMTGALAWAGADERPDDRTALSVATDGGTLSYTSLRKLGGIWLAHDEDEIAAVTGELGPDALGLSLPQLRACLAHRRGALKPALMDQRVVAGLGNLTVDEVLWRSRLHPRLPASLSAPDSAALHRALRGVLATSVRAARVPRRDGWLSSVRDEPGGACPRCGHDLERAQVGGRTTVWCPYDQRRG